MTEHLRIAIADDDAVTREFLLHMLLRMGHDVVCAAEDGRELADGCFGVPLDLVITDVNMPRLDGISAAAEIAWRRDVPIVLLSGSDLPERLEQLDHARVVMRRIKPISRADLEAIVAKALAMPGAAAVAS